MLKKVIVVGGGLAGLTAAHTVIESGCSVLLLEKNSFCGGNSTKATSGINGALTTTQAQNGIKDSIESFEKDVALSASRGQSDKIYPLGKVLCEESVESLNWLTKNFKIDLSPNVTNYIDKKFNSIAIRQQSGEEIKGTSSIFTFIQKQSKEDFSSCIRYNSDISNFTNVGCTSKEYGEGFLVCNCTTLKDISMTSYTQEVLNTSTVVVKTQSRFINSFSSFQYIDGESSIVLYFIICLLIIYLILLFFALLHDIRSKDNKFIVMVSNSDCCKSTREKEKDLHQMKNLIFQPKKSAYNEDVEKVTDNHEQFIEMNDMSDATDNSSPAVLQKKSKNVNPKISTSLISPFLFHHNQ